MERNDNHAPVTGTLGVVLGGIGTVGALAAGGMNLLGGGQGGKGGNMAQENAQLRAENAELKSKAYTDGQVLILGREVAGVNARQDAMDNRLEKMIIQNAADLAAAKELMAKDLEIAVLKAQKYTDEKVNAVAVAATQGITANSSAITALQTVVGGITKVVIPQSAVCDTANGGCCGGNQ